MPIVTFEPEERYPVYVETTRQRDRHTLDVAVNDETLARWRRVSGEFEAMQEEIDALFEAKWPRC